MAKTTETKETLYGENIKLVQCDNCEHVCTFFELPFKLGNIDITDRVDIGGEVPAGECPECDCLTYLIKDEPVKSPKEIKDVQMTEDEWLKRFKPIKSPFAERNGSWDDCMFETYGREVELVFALSKTNPLRVWTMIEADGKQYISQGWHLVNRLGYFITAVSADKKTFIEVEVDE